MARTVKIFIPIIILLFVNIEIELKNKKYSKIDYKNLDTIYVNSLDTFYAGECIFPDYTDKNYWEKIVKTGVLKVLKMKNNYYLYVLCRQELLTEYIDSLTEGFIRNQKDWKKRGYKYEEQDLPINSIWIKKECDDLLIIKDDNDGYFIEDFETCMQGGLIPYFLSSNSCDDLKLLMERYGVNLPYFPTTGTVLFIGSTIVSLRGRNEYYKQLYCQDKINMNLYQIKIIVQDCKIINLKIE